MQMKDYHVPLRLRLWRPFMKWIFRMIFRILGRVKVIGRENIPFGTAYVVAINHISIYDPPLVMAFWPETAEAIGATDVFQKKGQGVILRLYGVIPVHRGDYDRAVLETVLAILRSGRPLVIAPEGGRSHVIAMRRAKPGIGYIIEHARVPVLPVALAGTTEDFWQRARRGEKPSLEIRIGKAICFPAITGTAMDRREARRRNADLVMRNIAGLLPKEYHGVYAGKAIPQQ
jgi:1-acyl-sn-glycerol-3-phosphate acyltransferase